MSIQGASLLSSSSSSLKQWIYDIFLSFKGEDTRNSLLTINWYLTFQTNQQTIRQENSH